MPKFRFKLKITNFKLMEFQYTHSRFDFKLKIT